MLLVGHNDVNKEALYDEKMSQEDSIPHCIRPSLIFANVFRSYDEEEDGVIGKEERGEERGVEVLVSEDCRIDFGWRRPKLEVKGGEVENMGFHAQLEDRLLFREIFQWS